MKPIPHRGLDIGNLPIYNKTVEAYKHLEFLRDEKGRWIEDFNKHEEVKQGWYQNRVGDLYHYDGTVWDEVPGEMIRDLEYLG